MSTNTPNEDQEIDLTQVFKKIGGFFDSIAMAIFKGILFVKKNILIFIALFIVGAGLGYFIDYSSKVYDNEIIVSPNVAGVDYLYSKIDLLKSKLKEKDYPFFKSIGIKDPSKISLIEVEPIVDIYSFVNNSTSAASAQNTQNFELMKLLAESSDINKVIKDEITSKNYPLHKISIKTGSKISTSEMINPLLKYLNTDSYLNQIMAISKDNIILKIKKNEETISQTDSLIKVLTVNLSRNNKGSNLVYNNEDNQFDKLFDLKNKLVNEIGNQKISLVKSELIIKDIATTTNITNSKGTNGKMKLIFPIIFIGLFLLFSILKSFYNSQKAKLASK
jgi:hypothetical protein